MRLRFACTAAGAEIVSESTLPAYPAVTWDEDMRSLTLTFGRSLDGALVHVTLGPAEAAELHRRIRETYPPAQTRQRGRLPG